MDKNSDFNSEKSFIFEIIFSLRLLLGMPTDRTLRVWGYIWQGKKALSTYDVLRLRNGASGLIESAIEKGVLPKENKLPNDRHLYMAASVMRLHSSQKSFLNTEEEEAKGGSIIIVIHERRSGLLLSQLLSVEGELPSFDDLTHGLKHLVVKSLDLLKGIHGEGRLRELKIMLPDGLFQSFTPSLLSDDNSQNINKRKQITPHKNQLLRLSSWVKEVIEKSHPERITWHGKINYKKMIISAEGYESGGDDRFIPAIYYSKSYKKFENSLIQYSNNNIHSGSNT